METLLLSVVAFVTSLITAVIGLGGGMLLIAVMPGFVAAPAIIPVHSMVQLASNTSRAFFGYRDIRWEFTTAFLIGSLAGGVLAAQFVALLNLDYIPLFIAAFILFNVWGPRLDFCVNARGEFISIGALQTGLGMLVGATGPLGLSSLLKRGVNKNSLVVTTAVFVAITHTIKILMFGFLGFSFVQHWQLIASMITASVAGSFLGTRLRHLVPELNFRFFLKLLLTALALRMIYITLL